MEKLPPIEKIYEAYSALADNRVTLKENYALVLSSDGSKSYTVEWLADTYSSTDNASYWQGYAGYPIIGVLIKQQKLHVNRNLVSHFADVNWNSLNKKYKRDYKAALLEVFKVKQLSEIEITEIQDETKAVFEQLKSLDIKVARKIKR